MTSSRLLARALPVAAAVATLAVPGVALAAAVQKNQGSALPLVADNGVREGLMMGRTAAINPGDNHGVPLGHLPAAKENVELVGEVELTEPFGDVAPGQIADVSVHKNAAYLASWSEPKDADNECTRGGFFSVDISDPAHPKQLAFRDALPLNYHGEGMHAIAVDTPEFEGDLLAVNNETCSTLADNSDVPEGGGFDLYDVSNPADPVLLSRANGDYGPAGTLVGSDPIANEAHSVFLWQDDDKAYAILVDNQELTDVDIFDVSNPRAVQPVGEFDFLEEFPQIGENPNGMGVFPSINLHDMVVKEIGGTQTLLASYWDGGYVTVDVDDPGNPQYIADNDFGATDPVTGFDPPEGNAHQAEFSHDDKYILAADEDFSQYRFVGEITAGPNDGFEFFQAGQPDEGPIVNPEDPMQGDTVFVGEGCSAVPPPPAGVTIAVAERGTCTFQVKTEAAEAAGYSNIIIFNNRGTDGARCDTLLNMDFSGYTGSIKSLFVARSVAFRILDSFDQGTYVCNNNSTGGGTAAPAIGTAGSPVDVGVLFDGWGYAHVLENGTGKLENLGDFAIPEGVDERYALDFGDLSIHEFATDPETNLAYSSYYSGGIRVLKYGDDGLQEVGKYIDPRGSNFWGIEQFTAANGERLLAGSDRDFGLQIFRYTGPGAVGPKPAGPPAPGGGTPPGTSGTPAGSGGATTTPAEPTAMIRRRTTMVGKNRRFRIAFMCPASAGTQCRGLLRTERGRVTLARTSYAVTADKLRGVTMRLSRAEYRRLVRRGQQKVVVTILTRDSAKTLRRVVARLTLKPAN